MSPVATTILAQLGGNMFCAMTGAKRFVYGDDRLYFQIGRGANRGISRVRVILDDDDTYTVKFGKVRRSEPVWLQELTGVYAEDLPRLFTETTGFDTRL